MHECITKNHILSLVSEKTKEKKEIDHPFWTDNENNSFWSENLYMRQLTTLPQKTKSRKILIFLWKKSCMVQNHNMINLTIRKSIFQICNYSGDDTNVEMCLELKTVPKFSTCSRKNWILCLVTKKMKDRSENVYSMDLLPFVICFLIKDLNC